MSCSQRHNEVDVPAAQQSLKVCIVQLCGWDSLLRLVGPSFIS